MKGVAALALIAGLASRAAGQEIPAPAALPLLPQPSIRIAVIEEAEEVVLECNGSFLLLDRETRVPVWKPSFEGRLLATRRGTHQKESVGPPAEAVETAPSPVVVVQVFSSQSREAADAYALEMRTRFPDVPCEVKWNGEREAWRVRLGRYASPLDAGPLVRRLREQGVGEVWITEEPGERPPEEKSDLRLVDADYASVLLPGRPLLVVSADPARLLRAGGKPYRGLLEVRIAPSGRLLVVNELAMEDYLRGVVPNEMGPEVYPAIEALKAQAVAARTYALRNLGQFAEMGYDLCAGPRCQVYGGAATETEMTDRAVAETAGEAVLFEGKPAKAYFTSTCGGHTEDVENIFVEEAAPYLRGVECAPEALHVYGVRTDRTTEVLWGDGGIPRSREVALLVAMGIAGPEALGAKWVGRRPDVAEAARWTGRTLALLGKGGGPVEKPSGVELGSGIGLARWLVRTFGWEERLALVSVKDAEAVWGTAGQEALGVESARVAALLLREGILDATPGLLGELQGPASRMFLLTFLERMIASYGKEGLVEGRVRAPDGDELRVLVGKETREYRLKEGPFLFLRSEGRSYPVGALALKSGDRVRLRTGEDGKGVDFLEADANLLGAADDRNSSRYSWTERKRREDMESLLQEKLGVGGLRDIRTAKVTKSSRVVELSIDCDGGPVTVRGIRVRWALGLRENLFVMDRLREPDGSVREFVFAGKGWGHGVGLCQVGAYGMALRGKTYREILQHYYTGVEVGPPR